MTIYFSNDGLIDLDTIRTMGVSVKTNDSPIGYFGTGMKMAIATLLRTNHRVVLHLGGKNIEFTTREKIIRNQPFQMIYMEDEQLAFTTDLAKNWKVWQAYRELHSNCLDEMGKIGRMPVEGSDTIWAVTQPANADPENSIDQAFNDRSKIFLMSEASWHVDGIEVHQGKSKYLYYRNIRVLELPKATRFTYNFQMPMVLTEDRTLASLYDAIYKLGTRLPTIPDTSFASKIIEGDSWEDQLDFLDCWSPSEEFLDALELRSAKLSDRLKKVLNRSRKEVAEYKTMTLSEIQTEEVKEAIKLLEKLRVYITISEINFVEDLGPNVHGRVENDKIYISEACVVKGMKWIASTIYEEWIHKNRGLADESRGMQQYLFDKIFELIMEVK